VRRQASPVIENVNQCFDAASAGCYTFTAQPDARRFRLIDERVWMRFPGDALELYGIVDAALTT
jgi:hypothetical protein